MTGSGRVADRSVKSKTGGSLGFALRYTGGVVISAGSLREALAIAAWMSWAAASIFRLRLNCTVIRPTPSPLTEVMESTPAIAANSRSSGEAIEAAMMAGLAPGKLVVTVMVGKSTFGRAATGRYKYPIRPMSTIARVNDVVMTGRWMHSAGKVMFGAPQAERATAPPRTTERQHALRCLAGAGRRRRRGGRSRGP